MNPVAYQPPDDVRVKPPLTKDGTPGFILLRALLAHGKPVAFASSATLRNRTGQSWC
jgi:hypothetical protein